MVFLIALAAVMSACASDAPTPKYSDQVVSTTPFDDLLQPAVKITGFADKPVVDGDVGFSPGAPVKVTASDGRLTDVQITNSAGAPVPGTLSPDKKSWTVAPGSFGYNKTYTLTADAKGIGGSTKATTSFTTTTQWRVAASTLAGVTAPRIQARRKPRRPQVGLSRTNALRRTGPASSGP